MEIRKDFESAATYLHRLWGIGETFRKLAISDWSHMRNQEDFDRVYRLPDPIKSVFENLYADGRDMAYYMSTQLRNFNSVEDFPSMTSYVDSFERTWCSDIEALERRSSDLDQYIYLQETPWAVRQMIGLWQKQVALLHATNAAVALLKQTDIYRVEKGEIKVSELSKPNINVGVIGDVHGGKVNVGSTDSSTTINISAHQVFASLKEALDRAEIPEFEKQALTRHVAAMESNVGHPTFMQRYQDFIAAGANHMTLLGPFIPALSSLLGG